MEPREEVLVFTGLLVVTLALAFNLLQIERKIEQVIIEFSNYDSTSIIILNPCLLILIFQILIKISLLH